jgi:hypothetical protein
MSFSSQGNTDKSTKLHVYGIVRYDGNLKIETDSSFGFNQPVGTKFDAIVSTETIPEDAGSAFILPDIIDPITQMEVGLSQEDKVIHVELK